MKVSLNWAQHYSETNLKSLSTKELVKLATERLGGIESYTELAKHYEGIVVARIISCTKHANADNLNICKIDDGGTAPNVKRDENGYVQVVCGAPNAREGIAVAWIPPAAIVPSSYGEKELFTLEARDLRGELSNGMLASPRELDISNDHEGILEIDEDVKLGTPFKDLYDLDDLILDIENKMFTHRPDGFGQLGVARELAGIQHKAFKSPDWYSQGNSLEGKTSEAMRGLSVTINAIDACPRYMAVLIDNIQIKPSPIWLQSYLKRVGVRPINNVVDITNYMMMLTAQPLHAFDFDKVATEGKVDIVVRRPHDGEKMTLLDGKEIQPHKDAVLICSSDNPIALGGVMGGRSYEVDENTKRVVLECATFDMYNIRKTSMIHGLFTDAVTRFNKGQPSAQLPSVLCKAVQMFEELAGANMVGDVADCMNPSVSESLATKPIEITEQFINDRLGSQLSAEEISSLLTNVEFKVDRTEGSIIVTPPFWRTDIEISEDIVEEVGRLYGFGQLPITLPKRDITPVAPTQQLALKQELREVLSRAGANEVQTYSFVHADLLKKAGQDPAHAFALRNALSPDLQYYRLSILPSLLDKIRPNIKAGYNEFTLFEIGKTHHKVWVDEETKFPDEASYLDMVYTSAKSRNGAAYYQLLQTVDYTLTELGIQYKLVSLDQNSQEESQKMESLKPFDLERSAYIYNATNAGGMVGFIGELKESVIKAFKLPPYTAAAMLVLEGPSFELEHRNPQGAYRPLSKYPSTSQDVTLKISKDHTYAELDALVRTTLGDSQYNWTLQATSIYQKEASTKNVTFHITLSHHEHTLTVKEVNSLIEKITWAAHEALAAEQV